MYLEIDNLYATMMELEDIANSKSAVGNGVWVQVPLVAPKGLDKLWKTKDKTYRRYKMKVLVACEESQTVCKAFRDLGHEAYSCDIIEPSGASRMAY